MSEQTTMLERVSLICARHMDVFLCGGDAVTFPVSPSTAEWADYSLREQSSARFLARAVLECLRTPTPEMVEAAMDNFDIRGWGQVRWTPLAAMEVALKAAIDRALLPSKGEGE